MISDDVGDLKIGFHLYKNSVYVKNVLCEELESAYKIYTRANYMGYEFLVLRENGDQVLLSTGDYEVYQLLKLDLSERGVYQKWVDRKELGAVWENKETRWGIGATRL